MTRKATIKFTRETAFGETSEGNQLLSSVKRLFGNPRSQRNRVPLPLQGKLLITFPNLSSGKLTCGPRKPPIFFVENNFLSLKTARVYVKLPSGKLT